MVVLKSSTILELKIESDTTKLEFYHLIGEGYKAMQDGRTSTIDITKWIGKVYLKQNGRNQASKSPKDLEVFFCLFLNPRLNKKPYDRIEIAIELNAREHFGMV